MAKRIKTESVAVPGPSGQKPTGSSRTVVKAAASKSNNTDMSAFGMTGPPNKVKRAVPNMRNDAITSLLSGLNPTASQSNVKVESIPLDRVTANKSGKIRSIKRVSFAHVDKLVQVRFIERRGEEGQQDFNLVGMEGEGKIMRQHGHLEEQQTWYAPVEIDVIESKIQTYTNSLDHGHHEAMMNSSRPLTPTEHNVQDVDGTSDMVRQILPWNSQSIAEHAGSTTLEIPALPLQSESTIGFGSYDQNPQVKPIASLSRNELSNLLSALTPKPMLQPHVPAPPLPFPLGNYSQTFPQAHHISPGFPYQQQTNHENGWQQHNNQSLQTQFQDHQFGQRQQWPVQGSRSKVCYDFLNKGVCLRDNCTYQH